jgi:ABC-type multidrug transport system permease subunit
MADEEIEIRRAPKVLPWMLTGAVFGILIALVLFLITPPNPDLPENFLGLMLIAFGSLGLGLGVGIAIGFDLISANRAKRATAHRVTE